MTKQERRKLVKLLWKYQMDLLDIDEENRGKGLYDRTLGVKAQFNHARCIVNRLSYDAEQDIIR
jgi:hypothetical protein